MFVTRHRSPTHSARVAKLGTELFGLRSYRFEVEYLEARVAPAVFSTTLSLSSSENPVRLGEPVTFTAQVLALGLTPVPAGYEVDFFNGSAFGQYLGTRITDSNGRASITISTLPVGESTIVAQFIGGPFGLFDSFSFSSGVTNQSVVNPPPVTPISPDSTPSPLSPVSPLTPPPVQQRLIAGGDSLARSILPDGTVDREYLLFDSSFLGGVRVGVGDVTRDGVPDVFLASGPGGPPLVRAFDGATGGLLWEQFVFEESFLGGVYIAVGDLTGDGVPELVVSPDEGGGPIVKVLSGTDGSELTAFYGIDDPNFRGGARVALGDINGDKRLDILVSAGYLGGPRATVFDGSLVVVPGQTEPPPKLVDDFFAFEESLRNGSYVAFGDINGDGYADMIFGGGPGGSPRVLVVDGLLAMAHGAGDPMAISLFDFFAGNENLRDGVLVSCTDLNGDGVPDIIASAFGGVVKAYDGSNGADLFVPEILGNYGGYSVTGLLPEPAGGSEGVKTKQFAGPLQPTGTGSGSGTGTGSGATANFNHGVIISNLKGTYTGSAVMEYRNERTGGSQTGRIEVELFISDVTPRDPNSNPETANGGNYDFTGRVTVRVPGLRSLTLSITGTYTATQFPTPFEPQIGVIQYGGSTGYGIGVGSSVGADWKSGTITDTGFGASYEGEWFIPGLNDITLTRG